MLWRIHYIGIPNNDSYRRMENHVCTANTLHYGARHNKGRILTVIAVLPVLSCWSEATRSHRLTAPVSYSVSKVLVLYGALAARKLKGMMKSLRS
jgi:hypothetical protein